jgi:hypothetical protein
LSFGYCGVGNMLGAIPWSCEDSPDHHYIGLQWCRRQWDK